MNHFIELIGVYDILMALFISYSPHFDMLNRPVDNLHLRLYSYWILTYGVVRLCADVEIGYITIILEALCYTNELLYNDFIKIKIFITILLCCITLFP